VVRKIVHRTARATRLANNLFGTFLTCTLSGGSDDATEIQISGRYV